MTDVFVCQFMRVESFALVPSRKSKRRRRSAQEVVEELTREPHACPHVLSPRPPIVKFGNPFTLLQKAKELAKIFRDSRGRKLRSDAHVLGGCVVSFPVRVDVVESDDVELVTLNKWIDEVITWGRDEFGEGLVCAVLHMDETYPHLHLMLLPPAPGVHPSPLGRAARAARLRGEKDAKTGEKMLYKNDIRNLEKQAFQQEGFRMQDSLHTNVSAYYGHLRRAPEPERRLPPKAYRRRKAAEDSLRKTQAAMKARERELLEATREAEKQSQMLHEWELRLREEKDQLSAQRDELAEREASIVARESAIHALLLRPVMKLVDAMLQHGLSQVHSKLGNGASRVLESIIRHAWQAIGLPETSIESSAGHMSDAELKAMVQRLDGAEQDARAAVTLESSVQRRQLVESVVVEPDQKEWDMAVRLGVAR